MTMHCPKCGHNIEPDTTVERGAWRLEPYRAFFQDYNLHLKTTHAVILHTLASAFPNPVTPDALAERVSDAEHSIKVLRVQLSKLRRELGDLCPIETVIGFGYRWRDDPTDVLQLPSFIKPRRSDAHAHH